MPEPNPYEPPQSELSRIPSEPSRSAPARRDGRYFVVVLVGFQIAAGVLFFLSAIVRDRTPGINPGQQAMVVIFGFSFLVLGLMLILLALWHGSLKLLFSEVLALAMFLWLTLPEIH